MLNFTYHRAASISEAKRLFDECDDPSYVSGGHTLLPMMKNRLAAPSDLIDLRAIPEMHGIERNGDHIEIGGAVTHFEVSQSHIVKEAIPALAELAASIGDPQVRYCGTIGGSLANNDPAADYPSAALGLAARITTSDQTLDAENFFAGLYATSLEEGEILTRVSIPIPESAGYAKIRNPASRYAIAAAFVVREKGTVRIAITGAGNDGVFRWTDAEKALTENFSADALKGLAPDPDDMVADIHASEKYRAHLVGVVTRRAVVAQGTADIS